MDYTSLALESCIQDLKLVRTHTQDIMREESQFILSCLETGMIILREEVEVKETTPEKKTETKSSNKSILSKLSASLKTFFEKIKTLFRTKAVEQAKKHTEWIKANQDHIKKIASQITIEVLPYWEGDYKQHLGTIKSVVNNAILNIQNKKFNHSYASKIVDPKYVDDQNVIEYIKNFYRIGERDKLKVSQVKIGNKDLVSKVESMLKYTIEYVGSAVPAVNQLSDHIINSLSKVDKTVTSSTSSSTKFNISNESYLLVEGRKVCESDLVTCINYTSVVMEKAEEQVAPKEKEKTEVTNSEGKETSVTKVTVDSGSESSPSDSNKSNTQTNITKNEVSQEETNFINEVTRFIKLAFSAFTTVMEERYITYTNILRAIGNNKATELKEEGEDNNQAEVPNTEESNEEGSNKPKTSKELRAELKQAKAEAKANKKAEQSKIAEEKRVKKLEQELAKYKK